MEATSFSEQAPAARRDYFAGSNSGVGGPPGAGGNLPQRSVIVGVGPPSTSAEFRADRLAAVEPEPRGPALKWCPFAWIAEPKTCGRFPGPDVSITRSGARSAGPRRMAPSSTSSVAPVHGRVRGRWAAHSTIAVALTG